MSAEAALGQRERARVLGQFYELIIVPSEYFDQALDLLAEINDVELQENLQPPG